MKKLIVLLLAYLGLLLAQNLGWVHLDVNGMQRDAWTFMRQQAHFILLGTGVLAVIGFWTMWRAH